MSFNNALARAQANQLNQPFGVAFMEALYHGPARWWSTTDERHWQNVSGDSHGVLAREPGVRAAMRDAFAIGNHLGGGRDVLISCQNTACGCRQWYLTNENQPDVLSRTAYRTALSDAQRALARGTPSGIVEACTTCGQKLATYAVVPMRRKWIYVLRESGSSLVPVHEIEIGAEPTLGTVRSRVTSGRFSERGSRPFTGRLELAEPTRHTWHFFLSPVRLGPAALGALGRLGTLQGDYDRERGGGGGSDFAVSSIAGWMPWATTVKRRFQANQVAEGTEFLPLFDAFSWAAQISEFDVAPILFAQRRLVTDSDEQAKALICSVLGQAMGRREESAGPPPTYSNDPWDIVDDTLPVPRGGTGGNCAEAWMRRYESAVEFLSREVNQAVGRLAFFLRYCLAHRIIEMGCQDHHDEDGEFQPLVFGLTHWAHVLGSLGSVPAGQAYLAHLVLHQNNRSRIPQAQVFRGEHVGPGTPAFAAGSRPLVVTILAHCLPAVVAGGGDATDRVRQALAAVDVSVSVLGADHLRSAISLAVDVGGARLTRYAERLSASADIAHQMRALRIRGWNDRLRVVGDVRELLSLYSLLVAFRDYGESSRRDSTTWDALGRGRAYVETPLKAAEFTMKQTQRYLRSRMSAAETALIGRIEAGGTRVAGTLAADEFELLLSSRTVSCFRALGTALRVIAGPIGIITGGLDLVSETAQTRQNYLNGDRAAALGHGAAAAGALLSIAVAGAEVAALVTGATAAAWAGPVGWIAAALMLVGAVVIAFGSKNDLEMYGMHCFIGTDYGDGDWDDLTGKAWMAGRKWPELRYVSPGVQSSERWARQRLALLRMLSGFKLFYTTIMPSGVGYIYPGFLTPTSIFEVEVAFYRSGDEGQSPGVTRRGKVMPLAHVPAGGTGEARVAQGDVGFTVSFRGGQVTSVLVRASPSWDGNRWFTLRVRLDLDGSEINFLPASGARISCGSYQLGWGLMMSRADSNATD